MSNIKTVFTFEYPGLCSIELINWEGKAYLCVDDDQGVELPIGFIVKPAGYKDGFVVKNIDGKNEWCQIC